jgi:hypothetical protein
MGRRAGVPRSPSGRSRAGCSSATNSARDVSLSRAASWKHVSSGAPSQKKGSMSIGSCSYFSPALLSSPPRGEQLRPSHAEAPAKADDGRSVGVRAEQAAAYSTPKRAF